MWPFTRRQPKAEPPKKPKPDDEVYTRDCPDVVATPLLWSADDGGDDDSDCDDGG